MNRIRVMEEDIALAAAVPREKSWISSGVEAKLEAEMIGEVVGLCICY
jgi:hypothetical protein